MRAHVRVRVCAGWQGKSLAGGLSTAGFLSAMSAAAGGDTRTTLQQFAKQARASSACLLACLVNPIPSIRAQRIRNETLPFPSSSSACVAKPRAIIRAHTTSCTARTFDPLWAWS